MGRPDWGTRELVEDMAGVVKYAEVEITTTELLALNAAPKELVAAPGVGRVIDFISCLLAYDKGATTYTIGTATNLQCKLGAVAVSCVRAVTGFLDQAGDIVMVLPPVGVAAIDLSTVVNTALTLTLATAEMTDGTGPVHAKVAYRVHSTGL